MRNLVIMPTEKRTLNLGEYAEEATIIVSFHILTVHLLSCLVQTVFYHVLYVKLLFLESSPFHLHRMYLQLHAHKK